MGKCVLHDVMTVMTRRLEQLLVKQDQRRAKLFAELFDDVVVGSSKRPEDVTEETVSMSVEIFAQNSDVDARRKRRELEEPPQTMCTDSVVSIPVAVLEAESGTQQRQRAEPCTKMAGGVERLTRLADNNAPKETQDNPDDYITMLMEEMVDRLCGKVGHHYVGGCDHSEGHYRHVDVANSTRCCSPSHGPCRDGRGHWIDNRCRT